MIVVGKMNDEGLGPISWWNEEDDDDDSDNSNNEDGVDGVDEGDSNKPAG